MSSYASKFPTGSQIGEWTVIGEPVMDESSRAQIPVRCSCGDEHLVYGYNLAKGKSTQCLKCSSGQSSTYLGLANKAYRSSIGSGVQNFQLTASDLSESFMKQSGACALTGEPITISDSIAVRIDNNEGWTVTNTAIVSNEAKSWMGNLSLNEYVARCQTVVQNNPIEEFFNRREQDDK